MLSAESDDVRSEALVALGELRRTAMPARGAIRQLLDSPTPVMRARALRALVAVDSAGALPEVTALLADSAAVVRNAAIAAAGAIGPAARSLLPRLVALYETVTGRIRDVVLPQAIAAVSRDAVSREPIPRLAELTDSGHSLRSDGRGPYISGFDGVVVGRGEGFNLFVQQCPPAEQSRFGCRNTETKMIPFGGPPQRAMLVDLGRPVAASGATPRGIARDPEGTVRVFWKHDAATRRIFPVGEIPVGSDTHEVQRVQIEFVHGGRPLMLQFGEWGQGQYNERAPAVQGHGTSSAMIRRPSATEWIVTAPRGSVGRLWDVADPERPMDLGLYAFTFAIRFAEASASSR
jgi:hypothetical protein